MGYKQKNNPFASPAKIAAMAPQLIAAVAPMVAGKAMEKKDEESPAKAEEEKTSDAVLEANVEDDVKDAGSKLAKSRDSLTEEEKEPQEAKTQTKTGAYLDKWKAKYEKIKNIVDEFKQKGELMKRGDRKAKLTGRSLTSAASKLVSEKNQAAITGTANQPTGTPTQLRGERKARRAEKSAAKAVEDKATETIENISSASGVTDKEGKLGTLDIDKQDATRKVETYAESNEAFLKSFDNETDRKRAAEMGYDIDNESDLLAYIQKKGEEEGYRDKTTETFTPLVEQGQRDLADNKTAYEQRKDWQKQKRHSRRLASITDKDDPTFGGTKRQRKKKYQREHLLRTDPNTGETYLSDQARSGYGDMSTFQKKSYDPSRLTEGFKSATSGGVVADTEANRLKYGHMTREEIEAQLEKNKKTTKSSTAKLKKKSTMAKFLKPGGPGANSKLFGGGGGGLMG